MKFSQRHGHTPVKTVLQTETIDADLRNSLWSVLKVYYWDHVRPNYEIIGPRLFLSTPGNEHLRTLCRRLWLDFFKQPLDTLPDNWEDVYERLRAFFFDCKWYEVYDFVEFVAQSHPDKSRNAEFVSAANTFLEREVAAYRFIDSTIVRITSTEEVEAIQSALAARSGPVADHLERALRLLADRKAPDYRNSVKESISAVEALVRTATDSPKGTLGDLLKKLGRTHPIHPALEAAFAKLYGYTSDANGIRHALLDSDRVTFEEAKFMLVACSAFINYVNSLLKS